LHYRFPREPCQRGLHVPVGRKSSQLFGHYLAISWKRYTIGPRLLWNVTRKAYVDDRSMSILMTLSGIERRDASGPRFSGGFYSTLVPSTNVDQIRHGNARGKGRVCRGHPRLPSPGSEAQCTPPLGELLYISRSIVGAIYASLCLGKRYLTKLVAFIIYYHRSYCREPLFTTDK